MTYIIEHAVVLWYVVQRVMLYSARVQAIDIHFISFQYVKLPSM